MAGVNVGTLSARFGLDPSDFLERLRGVSGATQLMSNQMRREMNQTGREGAESLRLIDEALGVHMSRPLTRILTQEFPAFAKGLQAVLGGAVFGALATIGVEAFDKVERSIEKAQKAQEELRKATENTKAVFAAEIASYAEKDKAITSATEHISKLIDAQERETKAVLEAAGPWNHLLAAIGNFAHTTFSLQSTLNVEQTSKELEEFKQKFASLSLTDSIKGTQEAQKLLTDEIKRSTKAYDDLKAAAVAAAAAPAATVPTVVGRGVIRYSGAAPAPAADELAAAKLRKDQIQQIADLRKTVLTAEHGKEATSGLEEAARTLSALQRDIAGGMSKLLPETDPIRKLETEISGLKMAAENDFRDIAASAASALELRTAQANLEAYEKHLGEVLVRARRDADLAKATAALPTTIRSGAAPQFAPPTAMPTLGAGGLPAAQLDAFAKDQVAQLALIAKAQESNITLAQKYGIEMAKLDIAFQGRNDAASLATKQAAVNALINEYTSAAVKAATATEKLQEQMQRLLERSTEAGAGLQAFLIQLRIDASEEARFVYDALTSATKGAESTAADSLIKIIESHKDQHQKLIHELRAMWESYFGGLAKMALEHGMQKLLAPVGAEFGKLFHIPGAGAGKDAAVVANTEALHELTAAMLQKVGGGGAGGLLGLIPGLGGGGPAGVGGVSDIESASYAGIPGFAEGGDVSPGGSFIAGEAGAERIDLERGGAHVTPAGFTTGGVVNHNNYDMRGAVVTDDLLRKADAAQMMEHTRAAAVAGAVSVSRESSLRSRSQR